MSESLPQNFYLRPGNPDFLDLPWGYEISDWYDHCSRLEEVPRGISRHPVVFVNYVGIIYAIKEMKLGVAQEEYNLLRNMERRRLPVVTPVGHAVTNPPEGPRSILITRFLDLSLPYRSLFMRGSLERYCDHLLDAMAGLMVQLHLAGVYWGDCSLSNTLFRRDAGALRAYLVDAETAEIHTRVLPPTLRFHDLQIMEENVDRDLANLDAANLLMGGSLDDIGASIRIRYQNLWEEITRQVIISQDEKYRIQERIQALNSLGFSIGEVVLEGGKNGDKLNFRVVVTDRNFHRDQLLGLTGIEAEEMQARKMMNEIYELKATISQEKNRSTPLSVAAHKWMDEVYLPTLEDLKLVMRADVDPTEIYCQVLEHKWYLSERAQRDVGHKAATEDYIRTIGKG